MHAASKQRILQQVCGQNLSSKATIMRSLVLCYPWPGEVTHACICNKFFVQADLYKVVRPKVQQVWVIQQA